MQMLHAPTVLHEFDRQPVEQLRMGRPRAVAAEVEDRGDEGRVEVPRPDVIHRDARGEWIFAAGDPTGERAAAAGALLRVSRTKRSINGAVGLKCRLCGLYVFPRGGVMFADFCERGLG